MAVSATNVYLHLDYLDVPAPELAKRLHDPPLTSQIDALNQAIDEDSLSVTVPLNNTPPRNSVDDNAELWP